MGWKSVEDILNDIRNSTKERVENSNKNVAENANVENFKMTVKKALMTGVKK